MAGAGEVLPSAAVSIGMSPASPRAGSEVHLTGGAGAPSYHWDLDDDGQYDDAIGLDVTTRFPAGTRTVRARAATAVGQLTDSRTFTVHDWNVNPSGRIRVSPHSARVGAPVMVVAEGYDPDGPFPLIELDLDADGTFEASGTSGTATFATPGERVIRARFTDDAGATSVATVTLDVHAGNIAPTAEIVDPPGTVTSGGSGFGGWTVQATDPDGEIVRYELDLDGDGTYETDQGRDNRIPGDGVNGVTGARVTDDSGAVAVTRQAGSAWYLRLPPVVQVGTPAKLSMRDTFPPSVTDAVWDADGDGAFDDGTGTQIAHTYPTAGTYEVRARGNFYGQPAEPMRTISVREPGDIAVPRVRWGILRPVRPGNESTVSFEASAPNRLDVTVDLNGDGVFTDANGRSGIRTTFSGPTTVALKATDEQGRSSITTTQLPFVAGNLGPDVSMRTFKVDAPLQAVYRRGWLHATHSDQDDDSFLTQAWDTNGDGVFDDGEDVAGTNPDGTVAADFGVRVTDGAGVSTTLRRAISEIPPVLVPRTGEPAWLTFTTKRPRLATLLRRGLTVNVKCAKPKCKTRLVATLDAKPARKLKLRSRTVASRTVSGSKQATVKLTAKARRALKRSRSVKLTITATATAEGGARTVITKTLTIRR